MITCTYKVSLNQPTCNALYLYCSCAGHTPSAQTTPTHSPAPLAQSKASKLPPTKHTTNQTTKQATKKATECPSSSLHSSYPDSNRSKTPSGLTAKHKQKDGGSGQKSGHASKTSGHVAGTSGQGKQGGISRGQTSAQCRAGRDDGKGKKGTVKPTIAPSSMKSSNCPRTNQAKSSTTANFQDLMKLAAKNSLSPKAGLLGCVAETKERSKSPISAPVGKSLVAGRRTKPQESEHGRTEASKRGRTDVSGRGRTEGNGRGRTEGSGRGRTEGSGHGVRTEGVKGSGKLGAGAGGGKKCAVSAAAALSKDLSLARQPLRSSSSSPLTSPLKPPTSFSPLKPKGKGYVM